MFDNYLGISKQAFFDHRVVPANDNDIHNNKKCTFCWDSYHDDHPAVRVIPCNHVFGRDCLVTMTDAPGGDLCPICRASLFRLPVGVALVAFVESVLDRLFLSLVFVLHRLLVLQHDLKAYNATQLAKLGRGGKVVVALTSFWLYSNNIFYYADFLVSYATNLQHRNPQLDMRLAVAQNWRWMMFFRLVRHIIGNRAATVPEWGGVVLAASIVFYKDLSKITNYKDCFIFLVIMVASVIIGYLIAVISPFNSFGIQALRWLD